MKLFIRLALFLSLCCPIIAGAQITFNWTDLAINPGTEVDYLNSDVAIPISLDPGPAGPNQTWDFTSITVSESFHQSWVDPATTPHHALYPTANRCMVSDNAHYGYYCITPSGFSWCGQDTVVYHDGEAIYPFPCTYGDSWTTSWWSNPSPIATVVDSIDYEVDGWGTVTDQLGTFDCLRIKRHTTMTMMMPQDTISSSYWGYDWFVPGYGELVMMESNLGEPDPNFAEGYFRRMTDIVTGIRTIHTAPSMPNQVALFPAFPNPFNPTTQLSFSLAKPGDVSLVVTDQLGRQVAQLVKGRFAAGQYQATFDGAKLASGLYLASLRVDGVLCVQKLVLMK